MLSGSALRGFSMFRLVQILPISLLIASLLAPCLSAQPLNARIFAPHGVIPGTIIEIKILMESQRQVGGLDFTIRYNDSLFGFLSVDQDTGLNNWEYFSSSHDSDSNTINIFTIADIQNGPVHPDSLDFYAKGSIASYSFFVAPNWISDFAQEQFSFFWKICGDNAAANRRGDTLILLDNVSNSNGALIWNEPDSINFPESNRIPNVGTPDSCLTAADKVLFSINFTNGAAANYYICGDADANFIITISDAVFLINYIFAGGPVPSPLLSGDADCNLIVTISDAVYLINYIFAGGTAPCASCP